MKIGQYDVGAGATSATARRCIVLYLLALIGVVTLVFLLWKAFGPDPSRTPTRGLGPDDDPEFLWKVDREVRRRHTDESGRADGPGQDGND